MTPRMEAVVNSLTVDEASQMMQALEAKNDAAVWGMLGAKDFMIIMENDPLMHLLYRHDIQWGDVMMGVPTVHKSKCRLLEEDEDWIMPTLRLRKHIWENFPVNVVPIQSKDARECYAIQWHRKKFQEARDACTHGWEYMDFEDDTYRRMMKALSASRYWTVEEAVGEEDLCTIAMNFQEEPMTKNVAFTLPSNKENDSDAESVQSDGWQKVTKKSATSVPVLRRLNDIKAHFPAIWNEVQGCKSTTYALEIFGKKVKEQGLDMAKVKTDLLAALKASRSWTVLPATNPRHLCLLQMNFAA